PPGSLIIARPVDGSAVLVGDILVMQRPGQATVTHRVVEVTRQNDASVGRTKGDANAAVDAAPYPLGRTELVERWTLPVVGFWLSWLSAGLLPVALIIGLVTMATLTAVRAVRRTPPAKQVKTPARARGSHREDVVTPGGLKMSRSARIN
ncbi:MAG: hypothetical protein HKN26_13245, partial [Acidimicrobiales bacterium]|nr:hypothetical protein [Acidimicrobiales bacterium]